MCLAGASLSEEDDANLNVDIDSLFGFWGRRREVGSGPINREGRLTRWDVVFHGYFHASGPEGFAFHSLRCIDGRPNKFIFWVMGSPRETLGVLSQETGGQSD